MDERKPPVTFEVRIIKNTNYTWQGELITEDGETRVFRSEVELLQTVDRLLGSETEMSEDGGVVSGLWI